MNQSQRIMEAFGMSEDETAEEVVSGVKTAITKHFPDATVRVRFSASIHPSIDVRFAKGKYKDGTGPNGELIHNDPLFHQFSITGFAEDGKIKGKLVARLTSTHYSVKKTGWRATPGEAQNIYRQFDTYFGKLAKK